MMIWEKQQMGVLCDVFGIGGVAQGVGQVASAGIQAAATTSAANTEANAAEYAANQSYNAASQANQLQTNEFNTEQANLQPWLQAGTSSLSAMTSGISDGTYNANNATSGTYSANAASGVNTQEAAPTAFSFDGSDLASQPGYQFQLQQGQQALENTQSATGISGGAAAKELERYSQDYAGTAYNNAYNQALGTYQTNYQDSNQVSQENIANAESDYSNQFSRGLAETQNNYAVGQENQTTNFNRLATLAGLGQTATAQAGAAGQQYANQVGYNTTNAAAAAGNYGTQAGNASAAGTIGLGNNLGGLATSLANIGNYGNGGAPYVNNYYGDSTDNFGDSTDNFV